MSEMVTARVPANSAMPRRVQTPAGPGWQWTLRRNCALTPAHAVWLCVAPCAFLVVLGLAAWAAGFGVIAAFAAVEVLALLVAWLAFARHALDGDVLTLVAGRLRVEQDDGAVHVEHELDPAWLRVRGPAAPQAPIELSQRGQRVFIARHVCAHQRPQLLRELRCALAHAVATR